jgi:hypothetical protein
MPRYFFNVHHERASIDTVGSELPDKHAAWKEATVTAGETIHDIDGRLQAWARMAVRGYRRICEPALRTTCQRGTTKVGRRLVFCGSECGRINHFAAAESSPVISGLSCSTESSSD